MWKEGKLLTENSQKPQQTNKRILKVTCFTGWQSEQTNELGERFWNIKIFSKVNTVQQGRNKYDWVIGAAMQTFDRF